MEVLNLIFLGVVIISLMSQNIKDAPGTKWTHFSNQDSMRFYMINYGFKLMVDYEMFASGGGK